ncbi:S24 family peptidase [Ectopseudomonas mendocina]|uniref:S24 family peptidase n=1 Tax=Ectopseudomonas mendocina TaxID=300 RepID=A0ABZ2RL66_ECTME
MNMNPKKRPLTDLEIRECAALNAIYKSKKKSLGVTQEKIAIEGLKAKTQSAASHYLTGKNALNAEAASVFARYLQVPVSDFSPRLAEEIARMADASSTVEPGPPITSQFRAVRIVGTAQMGPEGYWSGLDDCEGVVDVPSSDPGAYALRLRGDSMAPAIRSGWIAVIEPNRSVVPGEYVMIRLTDGENMLKELLYANDTEISVMSINDAYGRRTIPAEKLEHIHYVGAIVPPSKART